ncbi:MAG: hypothetical protein IPG34_19580 [Rhodocyclaceae bacterium]|nr:hypothetical protein [Rhodocyclaceae bacterium]
MKLLDPNREVVAAIRRASKGVTKVIGRKHWDRQSLDMYGEFKAAAVDLARDSSVQYMEGMNEWGLTMANASSFATAEVALAKELNRHGIGAMIGGFSTSYLDHNLQSDRSWTYGRAMFDYLNSVPPELGLLHFHEYGHYMQYGTGKPGRENAPWPDQWDHSGHRWTGFEGDRSAYWDPGRVGWWVLRYRRLRKVLVAQGYKNIGFAITESGCDDVNPRPCGHGRGWRDFTNCEHFTDHRVGDMVDQFYWTMWQASHDSYIYGWTDFGFATADPAWLSFDYSQTPTEFERLIQTQKRLPLFGTPSDPRPIPIAPSPIAPTPGTTKGGVSDLVWLPGRGDSYSAIARKAYGQENNTSWATTLPFVKAVQAANENRPVKIGSRVEVPGVMAFDGGGLRGLQTFIHPGEGPWPLVRRCYGLPTAPAAVMGPIVAAVKYANSSWIAGGMVDLPGKAVLFV